MAGDVGKTILLVVDELAPSRMRAPLRFACRRARATGSRLALVGVVEPALHNNRATLSATMVALAELAEIDTGTAPTLHMREGDTVAELIALVNDQPEICAIILGLDARAARAGGRPSPLGAILNKDRDQVRVPVTVIPRHMSDTEIDLIG
jgi:hypothetical protein